MLLPPKVGEVLGGIGRQVAQVARQRLGRLEVVNVDVGVRRRDEFIAGTTVGNVLYSVFKSKAKK